MMIRSDGNFSEEEEEKINAIGDRLGGQALIWRTISASAQEHPSDEKIRAAVPNVTREEARNLIVSVIDQVAGSDGVTPEEESLISWVKETWKI